MLCLNCSMRRKNHVYSLKMSEQVERSQTRWSPVTDWQCESEMVSSHRRTWPEWGWTTWRISSSFLCSVLTQYWCALKFMDRSSLYHYNNSYSPNWPLSSSLGIWLCCKRWETKSTSHVWWKKKSIPLLQLNKLMWSFSCLSWDRDTSSNIAVYLVLNLHISTSK